MLHGRLLYDARLQLEVVRTVSGFYPSKSGIEIGRNFPFPVLGT